MKELSLTEYVTSYIGSIITPLTLGLGVTLDHMFGSKELLDLLCRLGLLKHPDEYRRFKTSAAHHILEQSKLENEGLNVHIPSNIVKGGGFIHEGDDNADVNCQTKDGKGTWHVLSRNLYQNRSLNTDSVMIDVLRIKRGKDKALRVTEDIKELMEPVHYEATRQRPMPSRV